MKHLNSVLFVYEPDRANEPALERAMALAEASQASLTIVDVVPKVDTGIGLPRSAASSAELQRALLAEHDARLAALAAPYAGRLPIARKVLVGTPFLELIREVLRRDHDLLIKAPEDPVWIEQLFGSCDMHLLRKCPCPVWLIKSGDRPKCRRVLAAVDVTGDGPEDELAARHALDLDVLDTAAAMALPDGAELHVCHAWEAVAEGTMRGTFARLPEADISEYVLSVRRDREAGLRRLLADFTERIGRDAADYLSVHIHLEKGSARRQIPDLAQRIGADLVVMGTVARAGVPGFIMGNTAESILNQLHCSVLAVKPQGFRTPVTFARDS